MSQREARTVLVTGSSKGIGRATSAALLASGHTVVGLARDHHPEENGYHPVSVDLADLEGLPATLQAVLAEYPEIDAVVSNAGVGKFGELEQFSAEQIRHLVDINLTSHILVARSLLPVLKQKAHSDLLFTGSESALRAGRKGAVYCAAKFGLRGLAQALREECAGSGVRVSIVHPGMVRTAFFEELDFGPGDARENALEPEEVATVILQILCLPASAVVEEVSLSPLKRVVRSKPRND